MSNETKALELAKELTFVKHTADWQTCDNASSELRRQHAENEANERNLGILSDELSKCEKHAKDLQTECTALRVNEENLTAQVESLRAQLEQKSERIAHLEATASSNYGRGHADAHQLAARVPEKILEDLQAVAHSLTNWNTSEDLEWIQRAWPDLKSRLETLNTILSAAPSQQAPVAQGEPVATVHINSINGMPSVHFNSIRTLHHGDPLYTNPQQASDPMTPEQIEDLRLSCGFAGGSNRFTEFVRAFERHHQIKGKQ